MGILGNLHELHLLTTELIYSLKLTRHQKIKWLEVRRGVSISFRDGLFFSGYMGVSFKMVGFPTTMVFSHTKCSSLGVWNGGIPPSKETPIWCFWEGYTSSSLLYGITSRLWPTITSWSFPPSTDVEEDGFQCGISGWKRLGSDDAWPPPTAGWGWRTSEGRL